MSARLSLAPLALLLSGVSTIAAQQAAHPGRLYSVLASTDSSTTLRLRLTTGIQLEGRLTRVDSGSLTLGAGPPVALTQVDHIWQRGTAWRIGGVIGALILAAGGAAGGNAAQATLTSEDSNSWALGGAVAGAAVGFAIGAGIGALIPRWQTIR